ncbi:MAG: hypothetical protein ABL888_19950 [Pirellulaceae bacterium]
MATSKRQISNSPNRNAVKQTHNEPRVKIWILLALLAMLTFGSSMFFYSRLANLDMAKKDLERPLIIQSAPAVASFRSARPNQSSNVASSQQTYQSSDSVSTTASFAE